MATGGVGTENSDSGKKSGGVSIGGSNSLLEGQYNETDSHKQFLEALSAWRNSGKPQEDKKATEKVIIFVRYLFNVESEIQ